MSTVPSTPEPGWHPSSDPLRRRVEFADVFAEPVVRPEVAALVSHVRRGVLDLVWIHELFAHRADGLATGVSELERRALRDAYALLFVEERMVSNAIVEFLRSVRGDALPLYVVDAVSELLGSVTSVEPLAQAWARFLAINDPSE